MLKKLIKVTNSDKETMERTMPDNFDIGLHPLQYNWQYIYTFEKK